MADKRTKLSFCFFSVYISAQIERLKNYAVEGIEVGTFRSHAMETRKDLRTRHPESL